MNKKQALLFSLCILTSTAAHAQQRNGLYYSAQSPAIREQSDGELHSLTYAKPDSTPVQSPKIVQQRMPENDETSANDDGSNLPMADGRKEEATASDKVWEKYKALATGQSQAEKETPAPTPAPAPVRQAKADSAGAPVGLAGIIQEYKKSKSERSEMHTLVITPPAEAEKIEAEVEKKREDQGLPPQTP